MGKFKFDKRVWSWLVYLRIIKEMVKKSSYVTAIFKTTAKKVRYVLKMLLVKQNSNIAGQNVLRIILLSE